MKRNLNNLFYLILVLAYSIVQVSCEKKSEITSPESVSNNNVKLSDEEISLQAKDVVSMVINNSIISQIQYKNIIQQSTSVQPLKKTSYHDENGYYILDKTFEDPQNATTGSIYLKIQFWGNDGKLIRDPRKSSSVYVYVNRSGAFGFVDNEPYGDKSRHIMEGIWSDVQKLPTFNGSGSYERLWSGLYSPESEETEVPLTLHYLANYEIQDLKVLYENNTIATGGKINVSMDDYRVVGICDGSIAHLTVYKGSEIIRTEDVDLSSRIAQLVYYLNMFGI